MNDDFKGALGYEIADKIIEKWKPEYGDNFPDLFEMKIKLIPKTLEGHTPGTNDYLDDDNYKCLGMLLWITGNLFK